MPQIERGRKAGLTSISSQGLEAGPPRQGGAGVSGSPMGQRNERECILSVKVEHLLCAPERD